LVLVLLLVVIQVAILCLAPLHQTVVVAVVGEMFLPVLLVKMVVLVVVEHGIKQQEQEILRQLLHHKEIMVGLVLHPRLILAAAAVAALVLLVVMELVQLAAMAVTELHQLFLAAA
jgi:hypothetical protein